MPSCCVTSPKPCPPRCLYEAVIADELQCAVELLIGSGLADLDKLREGAGMHVQPVVKYDHASGIIISKGNRIIVGSLNQLHKDMVGVRRVCRV